MHFWSFWAKYCHFLHILSNAWPKNNVNKVPRWVFRYVGNKTFDFSSKKKDFLPKNDQIWPKIGIFGQFGPGHAGLFGALLVGRLVVVARRLYLARHLFTLSYDFCWCCCPVGLESTWDDFGFPVLSCLSEAAALVLDNRWSLDNDEFEIYLCLFDCWLLFSLCTVNVQVCKTAAQK